MSEGLEHAGLGPMLPADQLARGLRALSYGLALDRLVDDGRGSEALFGRLPEVIFRGLAAEEQRAERPEASCSS